MFIWVQLPRHQWVLCLTLFQSYKNTSVFPSKAVWRNLVTRRIHDREEQSWRQRMLTKPNLVHLSQGHTHLQPLLHWRVAKDNPFHRERVSNLVNLLCGNIPDAVASAVTDEGQYYMCKLCKKTTGDVGKHFIMECLATNDERNTFNEKLDDIIATQDCCYLYNLNDEDQYDCLLFADFVRPFEDYETGSKALLLIAWMIYDVYKKVNSLNSIH